MQVIEEMLKEAEMLVAPSSSASVVPPSPSAAASSSHGGGGGGGGGVAARADSSSNQQQKAFARNSTAGPVLSGFEKKNTKRIQKKKRDTGKNKVLNLYTLNFLWVGAGESDELSVDTSYFSESSTAPDAEDGGLCGDWWLCVSGNGKCGRDKLYVDM